MTETPQSSPSLLTKMLEVAEALPVETHVLQLNLADFPLRLHSNSSKLLHILEHYFEELISVVDLDHEDRPWPAEQTLYFYQTDALSPLAETTEWTDWQREAGKVGRKDAVFDTDFNGQAVRLLRKVKTGMLFLQPAPSSQQSQLSPLAFGPIETRSSQIINFILTQYLNWHLRHGWLLAHTSGLQIQNQGLAFAGLSGGGKSTLMLHLLEQGQHFISNDRLLLKQGENGLVMRGIPKQPRINPGTIVHNPNLHPLISDSERKYFLSLPSETLRALEQKYDAPVNSLFFPGCYQSEAPLNALFILNWQAQSAEPTRVTPVNLQQRPDLLPAIMKTPGPFYARDEKGFLKNGFQPDPQDYLALLKACRVYEITGKIDFDAAQAQVLDIINSEL